MIINTGCRTDIPAFYSKWLMNRIREGYVLVRNPYNPSQVTKYSLSPNVADCLAFCTPVRRGTGSAGRGAPLCGYLQTILVCNNYTLRKRY